MMDLVCRMFPRNFRHAVASEKVWATTRLMYLIVEFCVGVYRG